MFNWYKDNKYCDSYEITNESWQVTISYGHSRAFDKEVCNKVEVEGITKFDGARMNCCNPDRTIYIKNSEITKEWLENNCECEDVCTHDYKMKKQINEVFYYNYKTDKCFGDTMKDIPKDFYKHGWYCKSYKCENYEVEVQ